MNRNVPYFQNHDQAQCNDNKRFVILQEERLRLQEKTFTKWINSFLHKERIEVKNLFTDLADGRILHRLLEIISGGELPTLTRPWLRVHKIANVNLSLSFIRYKVRLVGIGAEDIVDGNPRLILGLIWTIILRFQIQVIEIDVDDDKKSAKDALLLWVQRKTHGYPGVQINGFTNSWRNGLGFNALIHAHRPDLFDYNSLQPHNHIENLDHAFDVAKNEFGIPRLLDTKDIDTNRPDERSIMTYISLVYHTCAKMKNKAKSGRRIDKIIKQMSEIDMMKVNYHTLTADLLEWTKRKVIELENRNFPNSFEGIQQLFVDFSQYRTLESSPKYRNRSIIQALFFNINTQLKELRQPMFTPSDGKLLQNINRAWDQLQKAEYSREVALRTELRRQERLEQINYKFTKKSILRENYFKKVLQVLLNPMHELNLVHFDATVKKHEAIVADIYARKGHLLDLRLMSKELQKENYRFSDRVKKREEEVFFKCQEVLALLDNFKQMRNLMPLLREIETTLTTIYQLKSNVSSVDTGGHLIDNEKQLYKNELQELQVTSIGEAERRLRGIGEKITVQIPEGGKILKNELDKLATAYKELQNDCANKNALLEDARNFYQFIQDQEEEEAWLLEKQRICLTDVTARDLAGVLRLQQKHKLFLDEIKTRKHKFDQLGKAGKHLLEENHPRAKEIKQHLETNKQKWAALEKLATNRTKKFQDAAEAYQFYADANEVDSFLHEKKLILSSHDYGFDTPSAQAFLQRHADLRGELNAYNGDIQKLNNQADRLISAGISNLDLTAEPEVTGEPVKEITYENKLVLMEVIEVPQVKALRPFNQLGFSIAKGEVMYLLSKRYPDLWFVQKADGNEGFVSTRYVQEIQPKIIQKKVNKPKKMKKQKVKKGKMVMQRVPVEVLQVSKQLKRKVNGSNSVSKMLQMINDTYQECQVIATERHDLLEDAISLFGFNKECDDFERWLKDKEEMLTSDPDPNQNVEQALRKHKEFVTDLSASSKRLDAIKAEIKEFEKQNHSQMDTFRARYRQISNAWEELNKLRSLKDTSLEGASIAEFFIGTCDKAEERMHEKLTYLEISVHEQFLYKTVEALQRRQEQLEQDIAPIEKIVHELDMLAQSVVKSNPNEKASVAKRTNEITALWEQIKNKALDRKARLEDAVGQQIFANSANALIHWAGDVRNQLNVQCTARDMQTAEGFLKSHDDLYRNIQAHDDEFGKVTDLGQNLLISNPNLKNVSSNLNRLAKEQAAIHGEWTEKHNWLMQCLQFQKFNKDAAKIDAATSSHQAFLEFSDLGNSLDEVEAFVKLHRSFENTLAAQDTDLATFDKKAEALIAEKHYESQGINDKRHQVLQRRNAVKDRSQNRAHVLEASKNYQEFCAAVFDLKTCLAEKLKTASDERYRNLNNLARKLQKHEVFERELRANKGQLRSVIKMGQAIILQDGYRKDDVAKTLIDLNDEWQKLIGISSDKGRKLRQAQTQHSYNTAVEDVKTKLDEMKNKFNNSQLGNDMRSCKDFLQRHDLLENELQQCFTMVRELVDQSDEMMIDDPLDLAGVRNDALVSLQKLDAAAKKRREALEETLEYYKFNFEINNELQWINEHLPHAFSTVIGQNIHQAQNLVKKHKKLENEITGHRPVIDNTLKSGQLLIDKNHPEKDMVEKLCANLMSSWEDLNEKAVERAQKVDQSLKAQQYIFEADEVESWLNENTYVLSGTDYGRDRDAATKLFTKHKSLKLELDTYSSIVAEMGRGALPLIQLGHPESKAIVERQSILEHLVRYLQRKALLRQHRLMESLFRHESEELEQWIVEQQRHASSEDFGQDYEHSLLLEANFEDFKNRIEAGSQKFKQCEAMAQKLITNEIPYTTDIEKEQHKDDDPYSQDVEAVKIRHAVIRERWANLKDQIQNREQKLKATAKIHRFNRDVSDALSRINFKIASLGNNLGRDLNSASSLLTKQEAFENEMVVLEAQLQVLINDASELVIYPSHKDNIQINKIENAWRTLKSATEDRRNKLQASVYLHKFLAQLRDLTNWIIETKMTVNAKEVVRSAARAQALKDEHNAIIEENNARQDSFKEVAEMARVMDQTDHYASTEAVEKCNALFREYEELQAAWQIKNVFLVQLIDLHIFLREATQLEDISNAQFKAALNADCGETVEEIDRQLKKHNQFEKVLNTQDEKFDSFFSIGEDLLSQEHFDSATIRKRLVEVQSKREEVNNLCMIKRDQLEHAILYATFMRDVADIKNWIAEKENKLHAEIKLGEVGNFEDKIKMLQKQQTFEAEIAAQLDGVDAVKTLGETLIKRNHKASQDIAKQLSELDGSWFRLVNEIETCGKGLEDARDIFRFNNKLEKIGSWIRDKEVMVQSADTGRDYEHCEALKSKLDDADSDMRVDDTTISIVNKLAEKLIKQGHPGVKDRRDIFLNKWKRLQGALNAYRNKLSGAAEVHHFNRDVADTCQRINENVAVMESDYLGRNLIGVEALQRKQEIAEMEMTAVKKKIQEHDRESYKLSQKYPHSKQSITDKMEDLQKLWDRLFNANQKRKNALDLTYRKHKFLSDTKNWETWCNEIIKRMEARNKPNSMAEADAQLEFHSELKFKMNRRLQEFQKLIDLDKEVARDDLQVIEAVNNLEVMQTNLLDMWNKHLQDLSHEYQLQEFKEHADQLDACMASKEAFLNNDDMGESPIAVEALMRKHQDFEAILDQQLTRVRDLEDAAARICENKKYNNSEVENRLQLIINRKNILIKSAHKRKKLLKESIPLYKFLRNMHEVENWLTQKIQVASDENYQNPSNLQSKIQRHTTFEAEVLKNIDLIQSVLNKGQHLIKNKHYASKAIEKQLENLESNWKYLEDTSQLKKDRLNDAYQALLFNRSMDEFEEELSEVEIQLQSDEYEKDLASVYNLLKKHTILENDVLQLKDNCEAIRENSETYTENGHFMAYELQKRAEDVVTRYQRLQGPMQARRDLLEYTRDVNDELQWLTDREYLAASKDLGNSFTTVQSLQKKHQALEAEIILREPNIDGLISRATCLTGSGHHAANLINEKAAQLKTKLNNIRRSQDAFEAKLCYDEAAEAEAWYNDKKTLLESSEIGRDEDSTQSLQRKLKALGCEMEAYKAVIHELTVISTGLKERNHYDADNIKKEQEKIEMKFKQLQTLFVERETRLSEALFYFIFVRECTELLEWMYNQQAKAALKNYGMDVEHVELLIQAFDTFFVNLTNSQPRVQACIDKSKKIAKNSRHNEKVMQKVEEVRMKWKELMEIAKARKNALAVAKQVHMFDRTTDETITWIQEKRAILLLENFGQDLESIQALVSEHIAFESEFVVVKEQVDAVENNAAKLIEMYPDVEEHIQVKRRDAQEAWLSMQEAAERRKENLQQAEHLQTYYDEHQKLLAWINEMLTKINAPELPQNVSAAELLIESHKQHKVEIDAKADFFKQFFTAGTKLIRQEHFFSNEIGNKISILEHRYDFLLRTWKNRNGMYEQNLDVQLFKREANTLENWLVVREGTLKDETVGESINQVEDLIKKHEYFENMIHEQEEKFSALNRITLLEEAFILQMEYKAEAEVAERERIEQEWLANRKRVEMERIIELRKHSF